MGSLPSMTGTTGSAAEQPAERALFEGLVDDAAVFPPGNAPLEEAVRLHREHRQSRYAAYVGPLLVPASAAADLVSFAAQGDPLQVSVIGRPGTDAGDVVAAVQTLEESGSVDVVGAELGWTPDWRAAGLDAKALTLEVPRGAGHVDAVADVAKDSSDSVALQAKFRTGATPSWPWPDETELATFIRTAIDHDLGFKLTGGLHHAVRTTVADDALQPEHHGLLNVITAVRWALNGEDVDELTPLLAERDPAVLVQHVTRMSVADASIVRAFFTAYGCCRVTDPIRELTALNLLEESR
jgi:hypothetical protein